MVARGAALMWLAAAAAGAQDPPPASPAGRFFRDIAAADWSDWRWQVRNRVRTLDGLSRITRKRRVVGGTEVEAHADAPFGGRGDVAHLIAGEEIRAGAAIDDGGEGAVNARLERFGHWTGGI